MLELKGINRIDQLKQALQRAKENLLNNMAKASIFASVWKLFIGLCPNNHDDKYLVQNMGEYHCDSIIDILVDRYKYYNLNLIIGLDPKGSAFGYGLANKLGVNYIQIKKISLSKINLQSSECAQIINTLRINNNCRNTILLIDDVIDNNKNIIMGYQMLRQLTNSLKLNVDIHKIVLFDISNDVSNDVKCNDCDILLT